MVLSTAAVRVTTTSYTHTCVLAHEEGDQGDGVQCPVGQLCPRELRKGRYQVQLTGEGEGHLKLEVERKLEMGVAVKIELDMFRNEI